MTKFKIFFNNWSNTASCSVLGGGVLKTDAGKPVEVFGDLTPAFVPQDIWDDFVKAWGNESPIEDTLLYKRINPKSPAKFRKAHNFSFIIDGDGCAPNYLAAPQNGPYTSRPADEIEAAFKKWFLFLCKEKFKITSK